MSFKTKHYKVIRNIISKEMANFLYEYMLMKRKVTRAMMDKGFISKNSPEWGTWNDKQVPNTFSCYSDIAMEVLLTKVMPIMQKESKTEIDPTYSYTRVYKKGDVLFRHKDRPSCEISTTIFLGGDPWPIFIDPTGEKNVIEERQTDKGFEPVLKEERHKGIKVDLKPGDMLMYRGCELEHWREEFKGDTCVQVFLHYIDKKQNNVDGSIYDGRPHLGLPGIFNPNRNLFA